MTGSAAQSYFIFDSVNYSIGRKIYYSVEKSEPLEESESHVGDQTSDEVNSQEEHEFKDEK